jgi:DNA modification methylase
MDWHLDDGDVRIALGDARDRLPELADNSAQCLVTSPPFWNLRDYQEEEQIGLEETPEEWCAAVVEVMRECRRVLRKDGVAWIEVGDTYNAFNANRGASSSLSRKSDPGRNEASAGLMAPGLKNKDLVGAPWMLAFALRADGWYLRAENIWWKQNGMPESCTDRPTRMHTQVFLLSKSDRYFYDRYAVLEPHQPDGRKQTKVASNGAGVTTHANYANRQGSERWPGAGRNLRSVWSLPTEATHHGHYAAFPVHLAKRCILPGTSEHGACAECGAPYRRVVDEAGVTVGWEPSCRHADAGVVPCVVLDPFLGSGTTAVAARALGRHAVGIELSREYLAIADDRLRQQSLLT